jgi:hypothetical protein
MATHIRKQTRDAFATLVTGLTTTGARVFVNRVDPVATGDLPALVIATPSEQIERLSIGMPNPLIQRALTLTVMAMARANATVWDTLDLICQEVEEAVFDSETTATLSGLAKAMNLVATEITISGEGDRMVGTAMMQFEILVSVREGIPDTPI